MAEIKDYLWVFPIVGAVLGIITFIAPVADWTMSYGSYSIEWYCWIWGFVSVRISNGYYGTYGDSQITTNDTFQIFLDGELLSTTNYYFSDSLIESGKVADIYIASNEISYGDHCIILIGPQALNDEFVFTI